MTADVVIWLIARSAGVASFVALSISLLSGMALRTGTLGWLSHNRGVRALHDFTGVLWLPLGLAHVVALLFDPTAHVGVVDLVVPFVAPYGAYGAFAVGLGTISLQILVVVVVSSWLRRYISYGDWIGLHRLSYVAFGALFLHSVMAGTDFAQPFLARMAWITLIGLGAVGIVRLATTQQQKPQRR